jgi:hypothetical protein
VNNVVETSKRDPKTPGQVGLSYAERLDEFLGEHLTRMRGRPMLGKPAARRERPAQCLSLITLAVISEAAAHCG